MVHSMRNNREILFFDETSVNNWNSACRTWMDWRDPIRKILPQKRFAVTILGGICYKSGRAYYEFGEGTKAKVVKLSL